MPLLSHLPGFPGLSSLAFLLAWSSSWAPFFCGSASLKSTVPQEPLSPARPTAIGSLLENGHCQEPIRTAWAPWAMRSTWVNSSSNSSFLAPRSTQRFSQTSTHTHTRMWTGKCTNISTSTTNVSLLIPCRFPVQGLRFVHPSIVTSSVAVSLCLVWISGTSSDFKQMRMLGPSCTTDSGEYEPKQTHEPGSFIQSCFVTWNIKNILPQVTHETLLRSNWQNAEQTEKMQLLHTKLNRKETTQFQVRSGPRTQ